MRPSCPGGPGPQAKPSFGFPTDCRLQNILNMEQNVYIFFLSILFLFLKVFLKPFIIKIVVALFPTVLFPMAVSGDFRCLHMFT